MVKIEVLHVRFISFRENAFQDLPGSALELLLWDGIYVGYNIFFNVGGQYPGGPLHGVGLFPCVNTTGEFIVEWNQFYGTAGQVCAPPYTSSYYIDPVQIYVKKPFNVQENRADGESCIGLLVNNMTPFECDTQDPQKYLRYFYGPPSLNSRVKGAKYDLAEGPEDAAFWTAVDADPQNAITGLCHWCNDGCPTGGIDVLIWTLMAMFFSLLLCLLVVCFCCPALCFCCPPPDYEWHEDDYLKMKIPNDRNNWPAPDPRLFFNANDFGRAQMLPTANNPTAQMIHKNAPQRPGYPHPIPY